VLEIDFGESGEVVVSGRLDAASAARAQEFLDGVPGPCVVNMAELEYISSAGLGVLLKTHKRLMSPNGGLRLVNVNKNIIDVFRYSGFDKLFEIEAQ
jgi:anti-sigma B factor antagonist